MTERMQRMRRGEAIPAPLSVEVSGRGRTRDAIFVKRTHFPSSSASANYPAWCGPKVPLADSAPEGTLAPKPILPGCPIIASLPKITPNL